MTPQVATNTHFLSPPHTTPSPSKCCISTNKPVLQRIAKQDHSMFAGKARIKASPRRNCVSNCRRELLLTVPRERETLVGLAAPATTVARRNSLTTAKDLLNPTGIIEFRKHSFPKSFQCLNGTDPIKANPSILYEPANQNNHIFCVKVKVWKKTSFQ